MILIVIFTLFILQDVQCDIIYTDQGPLVETNVGSIRGVRAVDGDYNMFMGIPYATVNESNIFGSSIPYPPFEGIFEANNDSAICPQIEQFESTIVGSLDCLDLNVYVPDSASSENPLPVMVYIFGGGFQYGFANRFLYGPQFLIRYDVILVTINYRLGAYGFMCLDIPEVPGNQGLKDQVTALRWVKNNIKSFGGDPDKVTLFGNSVGARSNGYHMISDTEKLFNNIIMQSGSAFNAMGFRNLQLPQQIAAALGYTTNDTYEALNYLSTVDTHTFVNASAGFAIGPCTEKKFPDVERFMSEYAINSNHSKAEGVPILYGYSSEEMLSIFSSPGNPGVWAMWSMMFRVAMSLIFNFEPTKLLELEAIVRRFYIGDEEIDGNVREQMMHFLGDILFVYPKIRGTESYLAANSGNIYQYMFSYDGGRNFVKIKDGVTLPGAAHADELGYLFKMEFIPETPSPADQLIIDRMTTMWTNFAKYGNPTPETSQLLPIKWEPIIKGSPYYYLELNTEMSIKRRFATERMSFWDLFHKAYRKYEWTYVGEDEGENEHEGENGSGGENGDGGENGGEEAENGPDSASSTYLSPILGLSIVIKILASYSSDY